MGKDNQPKVRQQRDLERKRGRRPGYDRILIVCEDTKSAPQYFKEIRQYHRLVTANVQVEPSMLGTAPKQVVEYAKQLFLKGDPHKRIGQRAFDRVYAVFDRDDHMSYHDALNIAKSLDGKHRNDEKRKVIFQAIASVPCFELWLLLHYEDIRHGIHRNEVQRRLKIHIPNYDKGAGGYFELTRGHLEDATLRARRLAELTSPYDGKQLYTDIDILVNLLSKLRR